MSLSLRETPTRSVCGVGSNLVLQLALAREKGSRRIRRWHVVLATEQVVMLDGHPQQAGLFIASPLHSLLAVVRGGVVGRITKLEAELTRTDEVVPALGLLIGRVVPRRETGGVDETTERVTGQVRSVRVELSSAIVCSEVDGALVEQADDLDVCGGFHEPRHISIGGSRYYVRVECGMGRKGTVETHLNSSERTRWKDTRSVSRSGAL